MDAELKVQEPNGFNDTPKQDTPTSLESAKQGARGPSNHPPNKCNKVITAVIVVCGVIIVAVAVGVTVTKRSTPKRKTPNIIVMQPDDFPFFAEWSPPPKNPVQSTTGRRSEFAEGFPKGFVMPNLEILRKQGLQMTQAYTASSGCATSRYSTITGRYASRSGFSRMSNVNETVLSNILVPNTLLLDVEGQAKDCSKDNIAVILKNHGYHTGVVGKWHLSEEGDENDEGVESRGNVLSYSNLQAQIRSCGFDFADGIYAGNLPGNATYSHNHEWVTSKGIEFIKSSENDDKPFFLYFNPTVPHPSGDIERALLNYTCKQTPNGILEQEPQIPRMTDSGGCEQYRNSIIERAGGSRTRHDLGAIWIDDSVGALLQTLADVGKLDNTIFLFQLDHGIEAKFSQWENGNRIPQFVHYPDEFGTSGKKMSRTVSTVDVTPTLLDFAGVRKEDVHEMDGESWRNYPMYPRGGDADDDAVDERCVFSEYRRERALVCNRCHKLIFAQDRGGRESSELGYPSDNDLMYFNLCDKDGRYVHYPNPSMESVNVAWSNWGVFSEMEKIMNCYVERTSPRNIPSFRVPENCFFASPNNVVVAGLTTTSAAAMTGPPDKVPTFSPSSSPTLSPRPTTSPAPSVTGGGDCKDYEGTWIRQKGNNIGTEESCALGAQRPGDKFCRKSGAKKCPVTCGSCENRRRRR